MLHDCLQHFYVGGRKAKQNIQVVQNLGNIRQCTPKYFHTDVSAPRYDSGRANVARQCFHFWSRKAFKNGLIHSGQGAGGYHDEENWTLGIMASHPPRHFMFAGRQKCQWGPEQRTHDFCVEKLAQTSVWQLISIPLAPTITSVRCGCCFACRKKEKKSGCAGHVLFPGVRHLGVDFGKEPARPLFLRWLEWPAPPWLKGMWQGCLGEPVSCLVPNSWSVGSVFVRNAKICTCFLPKTRSNSAK